MELLQSHNIPFLAALVLMVMLAVSQVLGLGDVLGGDADVDVDLDTDASAGDGSSGEVGFLGGACWALAAYPFSSGWRCSCSPSR